MEKEYKYRFTLFTPCYNSAPFIERIKGAVQNQTFRDFEWIVVNDNSSDNTLELLEEFIKTVDFPVKLIDNKENKMLAVNYNLAVDQTEGEYFVTLDHDDEYSPKYLEIMDELIRKYDGPKIAGVVARCQTQYGKITPMPDYSKPVMNWFEYGKDKNGNYTGEVPRALKTSILRKYIPFDPKLVHNPVVEALMSYDGYSFITTNEIIRKYYVFETTQLSISNSRSNRLAYYTYFQQREEINKYTRHYRTSASVKYNLCLAYCCASIRYGLSYCSALKNLERWKFPVAVIYPFAALRVSVSNITFIRKMWYKMRQNLDKKSN